MSAGESQKTTGLDRIGQHESGQFSGTPEEQLVLAIAQELVLIKPG